MKRTIGNFENLIEIHGMRFLVLGLNVGQYLDLISKNFMSKPDYFYKTIAMANIIDWEGVFLFDEFESDENGEIVSLVPRYDEDDMPVYLDFCEDNIGELHDSILSKIGKEIYHTYSTLSKLEIEKYQAFARWMYYSSSDETIAKNDIKTFDCEQCIKDGHRSSRKCGLTELSVNMIKKKIEDEGEKIPEDEKDGALSEEDKKISLKYKLPQGRLRKSFEPVKEASEEDPDGIYRDFFMYSECPTSFIDAKTRSVAEKIYFAHKSRMPFFSGGMIDQDNRFVTICQIINSECNKIESERHKRDQQEAKKRK